MREAIIVSSVRTPVEKAPRGTLRATRPDDFAATAVREAVARAKPLDRHEIEDVILDCAIPEAEQGMNVARIGGGMGAAGIFERTANGRSSQPQRTNT
jgi:acetyl-CoA acyltransferase